MRMLRSSLVYALKKGKIGKAVEIGVKEGKNAEQMLKAGVGELSLVDPYLPYRVGGFRKFQDGETVFYNYEEDSILITQEEQDSYRKEMLSRVAPYGNRVRVFDMTSEQASKLFPDGYFDYGYIDGNHEYQEVRRDLELWYPKVGRGGTFAGHDFNKPHLGVTRAVMEFAQERKLKVVVMGQVGDWTSNQAVSDWWVNV